MAEALSEEKQIGVACGTPVLMILLALGAGQLDAPNPQAKSVALSAAHDEFQASISPTISESEKPDETPATLAVTSLKPELKPIEEAIQTVETASAEELLPVEELQTLEDTSTIDPADLVATTSESTPNLDPEPAVPPAAIEPTTEDTDLIPLIEANDEVPEATLVAFETTSEVETIEPAAAEPPSSVLESSEVASIAEPEAADPPTFATAPLALNSAEPSEAVDPVAAEPPPVAVTVQPDPAPSAPPAVEPAPAAPPVAAAPVTEAVDPAPATPPPASPAMADAPTTLPEDPTPVSLPDDPTESVSSSPTSASEKPPAKPFLGVGIRNPEGNVITTLYANSTAVELGLKLGDQLVGFNGQTVTDLDSLRSALAGLKVADSATVEVIRSGVRFELGPVALKSRPTKQ